MMRGGDFHTCSQVGAYLAACSVRDATVLFHAPPGCRANVVLIGAAHDLLGFDGARLPISRIGENEAICGGEAALAERLRAVRDSDPSGLVVLLSSCVAEIAGDDLEGVAARVGGDTLAVHVAGFLGDLWHGFATALDVLAAHAARKASPGAAREDAVTVVGNFFHRFEGDAIADAEVFRSLLGDLGLAVPAVLASPMHAADLGRVGEAGSHLVLPLGRRAGRTLAGATGTRTLPVDLPLGLEGTVRFLKTVGEALGRDRAADEAVDRGLSRAVPAFERLRDGLLGIPVAVCADAQHLPGLVSVARELGLVPTRAVRHDDGRTLPDDPVPGVPTAGPDDDLSAALDGVDLVLGGSFEASAVGDRLPVVEVSWPRFERHGALPEPSLGFDGALALAARIREAAEGMHRRSFGIRREMLHVGFEDNPFRVPPRG